MSDDEQQIRRASRPPASRDSELPETRQTSERKVICQASGAWRPPTRRAFFAMLGAAAAAIAVRETTQVDAPPRQRIPRWIGHC